MTDTVTVTRISESDSLGITLPMDELRERNLKAGDEVVLLPGDDSDTVTLYFPPQS